MVARRHATTNHHTASIAAAALHGVGRARARREQGRIKKTLNNQTNSPSWPWSGPRPQPRPELRPRATATAMYRITAAAMAAARARAREPQGATAALVRREEHVQGLSEKSRQKNTTTTTNLPSAPDCSRALANGPVAADNPTGCCCIRIDGQAVTGGV